MAPPSLSQQPRLWTSISFRHTLLLLRGFWLTAWLTPPGNLPHRLDGLHQELALLILPPDDRVATHAPSRSR